MSDVLEKSLDEIIGEQPKGRNYSENTRGGRRPRGPRRHPRDSRDFRERSTEFRERSRGTRGSYRDRYEPPRQTKLQRLSSGQAYLKISNLHYEISDDDLKRLFESVGEVSFVRIEYDSTGRSSGVAYLGFKNVKLNGEAISKFDGRKAVGQHITVEEIKPLNVGLAPSSSRSRSSKPPRPAKPTAEELDKELEQYMSGPTPKVEEQKKAPVTADALDKELEDYMNQKPFPVAE